MMKFDILTKLPVTACEDDTHLFAGQCTPDCVRLVELMSGDGYYESMVYTDYLGGESSVDWSGTFRGPLMPEEAIEYDVDNRAVIIVLVHPDGCECPAHEDECHVSIVLGPRHDPYGAECEVVGEHVQRNGRDIHRMTGDPFGNRDGEFRWLGGGSVAGDSLPYEILSD